MRTLTAREQKVLRIIADHGDNGATASQITTATQGCPPITRVWTAQQAARVARELVDMGLVRRELWRSKMNFYKIRSMGRGYLSVPDPDEPVTDPETGQPLPTKTGRTVTEGEIGGYVAEAEEGYDLS